MLNLSIFSPSYSSLNFGKKFKLGSGRFIFRQSICIFIVIIYDVFIHDLMNNIQGRAKVDFQV